jgi:hypothetical protein
MVSDVLGSYTTARGVVVIVEPGFRAQVNEHLVVNGEWATVLEARYLGIYNELLLSIRGEVPRGGVIRKGHL